MQIELKRKDFQSIINGKLTDLYFLESKNLRAILTNYGARMVSLSVPDKHGNLLDINVGFDSIEKYVKAEDQCYGAIVGRYAGRIAHGNFKIDDANIQLKVNNGTNAIHGGDTGFQTKVWEANQTAKNQIEFTYISQDGEEGYPGTLTIKVIYELTDNDELKIKFTYSSDKKTVANVINHNFWNLNGEGSGSILNHSLKILTDKFNAIDNHCIPTNLASVQDTPFDFTDLHLIGKQINANHPQIKNGTGYDHTYAFGKGVSKKPELVAIAIGDISGIRMELYTTEPGVHFYTGNFMLGLNTFKSGKKDDARTAFCLETQHYPNSPNNPSAPTTIKVGDQIYASSTIHKFSVV